MSVSEDNWQSSLCTIEKRAKYMFNNNLLSDVTFVVRVSIGENESKKAKKAIPAHKFVLAIGSPVFFAMFCGKLAETSNSIVLPDCEYGSLLELFRYMYCYEVNLDPDNVMQVLYLAQKYMIPSLVGRCIKYLEDKLDASNVFCIMPHAQNYGETKLLRKCWSVIDSDTEDALKSDAFVAIERTLLESVVGRDSLKIKELELFKAVDRWATNQCALQGLKTCGTMKRRVLGEHVVKRIRFPVMQQKEFIADVLRTKILTSKEAFDMVEYFHSVLTSPVGFSEAKRGRAHQRCCRFGSVVLEVAPCFTHNLDRVIFSVDKDVVLHGVCLFGSEKNQYPATVETGKIGSASPLGSMTGKFSSVHVQCKSGSFYGFDVLFDSPVSLKKGTWYYVKASLSGPVIWHGVDGVHTVRCPGVKFRFRNSKKSRGTTVKEGQFPQLIFSHN